MLKTEGIRENERTKTSSVFSLLTNIVLMSFSNTLKDSQKVSKLFPQEDNAKPLKPLFFYIFSSKRDYISICSFVSQRFPFSSANSSENRRQISSACFKSLLNQHKIIQGILFFFTALSVCLKNEELEPVRFQKYFIVMNCKDLCRFSSFRFRPDCASAPSDTKNEIELGQEEQINRG